MHVTYCEGITQEKSVRKEVKERERGEAEQRCGLRENLPLRAKMWAQGKFALKNSGV